MFMVCRRFLLAQAILLNINRVPSALGEGYDLQLGSVAEPAETCDSADMEGSCHSVTAVPKKGTVLLQRQNMHYSENSGASAPPLDTVSEKTLERILKMEAANGDDAAAAVAKTIEGDHKAVAEAIEEEHKDVTDNRDTIQKAIKELESSMEVENAVKNGVLVNSQLLQEINGEEDTPESVESSEEETAFQGDMMVEPSERPALVEATRSGHMTGLKLWNKGAPIKFCFASDIKQKSAQAFVDAVQHYHDLIPCLKFVQTGHKSGKSDDANSAKKCDVSPHEPAIFVQSSMNKGCSSGVGVSRRRRNNVVVLQLKSPGCDNRGTAAHEIGHALGMSHEQSRPDRDNYVRILWGNIPDNKEHNFVSKDLKDIAVAKPLDQTYDFLSLMHYGPTAFGGGKNTIESKVGDDAQKLMGQRFGLTQNDAKQIATMYGCLGYQEKFKVCSIDLDSCTPQSCTCHGGFKMQKTTIVEVALGVSVEVPCWVCLKKECPKKRTSLRRREYSTKPCGCAPGKKFKTLTCRRRSKTPDTCFGCENA